MRMYMSHENLIIAFEKVKIVRLNRMLPNILRLVRKHIVTDRPKPTKWEMQLFHGKHQQHDN